MFCCMLLGGIIKVMQQGFEHDVISDLLKSPICHSENLSFVLFANFSCVGFQLL